MVRVLGFDGAIDGQRSIDILLVPQPADQQDRHLQRLGAHHLVHGLLLPERVVGRMLRQLPPEADLVHAVGRPQIAGRAVMHKQVVFVVEGAVPMGGIVLGRILFVDVGDVLLTEGAVVEPVVAAPAVDHRVHRHRDLQGRVRIDQGHQRRETVIGNADNADTAVRLLHVLHQPVDGVVGVGRVVDLGGIERPGQRPVHDIFAFRTVLAAHVLDDADIAGRDDDVGGVVIAFQHRFQMRRRVVRTQAGSVIGRARQQHRRVGGAFRYQDDGVQLHPVAHRDHHVLADEIEAVLSRGKGFRSFVGGRNLGQSRYGKRQNRRYEKYCT